MKKFLLNLLVGITLIVMPFTLKAQTTINRSADATVTTSFVSSWENLAAVNDGIVGALSSDRPAGGVYGNWDGEGNYGIYNWIQYEWASPINLYSAEVFWFSDGGGIGAPTDAYIEYWDGTSWINAGAIGLTLDEFNVLDSIDVSTNMVRVNMKSETATGVVEFRVFETVASGSDATLDTLSISVGELSPVFDAATTSYIAYLPSGTTAVTPSATTTDENATITAGSLDEVDVTSGTGTSTIEVTAQDGTTIKTYSIKYRVLDLTHSYLFRGDASDSVGSLDGTLNGTEISVANGSVTVTGSTSSTSGFLSFDAAELDLKSYDGITMEAFVQTENGSNTAYTMLAYFGNNNGGSNSFWFQPTIDGTGSRVAINNTNPKAEYEAEFDDGNFHHVVFMLTNDSLLYYLDGALVANSPVSGAGFISGIDTIVANVFKGPDGWADKNYNASIDEFNIYNGKMTAEMIAERFGSFKRDQGIAFEKLDSLIEGSANFDLMATASSGLEVNYTSSNESVATISGSTVTIVGAGETIITASQAGNDDFNAATNVQQTLVVEALDHDASLSAVEFTVGTLDQEFTSEELSYTVTVPVGTTTTTLSAIATSEKATIDGTGEIVIAAYETIVTVKVTAEAGDTLVYTFTIELQKSDDSSLASLSVDTGDLTPEFDTATLNYTLEAPIGTTSVTVTAEANSDSAKVAGAGAIDVSTGSGTATIVVTAEDGSETTYTIAITVKPDGINLLEKDNFNVYPTVSNEGFNVKANVGTTVQVYNITGKLVKTIKIDKAITKLELSNEGVYLVKNKNRIVRIIKIN